MVCASAFMIAESTLNSKPFQNAIFNSQFTTQNEIFHLKIESGTRIFFKCYYETLTIEVIKFSNFSLSNRKFVLCDEKLRFLLCVTPEAYVYLVRG